MKQHYNQCGSVDDSHQRLSSGRIGNKQQQDPSHKSCREQAGPQNEGDPKNKWMDEVSSNQTHESTGHGNVLDCTDSRRHAVDVD